MSKLETIREMHKEFTERFPQLSRSVDSDNSQIIEEVGLGTPFFWFECLAKYINDEMVREIDAKEYKEVFEYFRSTYLFNNNIIKECIDVSFVENLFFGISPEKSKPYWDELPLLLQDLYLNFHRKKPL